MFHSSTDETEDSQIIILDLWKMRLLFELTSAQANNQWNIGAELGSDPMESAFALTLTSGIKGVAMVLDREVKPLTSG